MPIRKVITRRRGFKPYAFFFGTEKQLREHSVEKAHASLKGLDPVFKDIEKSKKTLEKLQKNIISKIEEMTKEQKTEGFVDLSISERLIQLKVVIRPNGKIFVGQFPVTHGITSSKIDSFQHLNWILKIGFWGRQNPNVYTNSRKAMGFAYDSRVMKHDRYSLEIMAPMTIRGDVGERLAFVKRAHSNQILCINIEINAELTDKEKINERKKFYRKRLKGWPIHFV
ncbi:MAG: hypothetical protein V1672_05780 [Candidatus Diapherotrites archaeon]